MALNVSETSTSESQQMQNWIKEHKGRSNVRENQTAWGNGKEGMGWTAEKTWKQSMEISKEQIKKILTLRISNDFYDPSSSSLSLVAENRNCWT